jgi:hypothetical protein
VRFAARASLAAALFALALALAACDGGGRGPGTPVTKQPIPRSVVSDDGKLTLIIPAGVADDTEITATAVPLEELPVELRQLRGAGGGYRLEPEGLEFSQPVEVSLELEVAELEAEPAGQTSAYALISFSEDAGRQVLEGQSIRARLGESSLIVGGSLSHLSYLGRTRGSLSVSLAGPPSAPRVGAEFSALAEATNSDTSGAVTLNGINGTFEALGALSFEGLDGDPESSAFGTQALFPSGEGVEASGRFKCQSAGLGSYGVQVSSESIVEVEGRETVTLLTVAIDAVVVCAE